MRICYLYGGGVYRTDGGIGFLRNLCSQLKKFGHDCFAILGGNEEILLEGTVDREIHVVGDWSIGQSFIQRRNRSHLREFIKDMNPNVVHIIHPPAYYGPKGQIHALPVIWRDFPVVVTFWGFNIGKGSPWLSRALVLLLLWGSQAVASHDFKLMKQARQMCLGLRLVQFLPVGSNIMPSPTLFQISRQDLRQRFHLDLKGHYIGYFGGFDRSMGVEDLFQAARRLREKGHSRLRLVLIGWQRHLQNPRFIAMQQAIEREQLKDVIIMTPFAPDEEVAALLRAVDLVVLPFRQNSMGRTSLMATLCAGAPAIVASPFNDLGPLNGAVLPVPPYSPKILAEKIEGLLNDSHRTEELAWAGRRAWEYNFSWPVIAKKHLDLYQTIQRNDVAQ